MTLSSDSRASSPSGLAQHHYQKALELEKHLLTSTQSKGPFDPNVRILRNNIRELYEFIILEDHEFAESHDVEQLLWRLHYTRIEEFRARIRKSMSSAASVTGTAVVPSGNKPSVRREPVHKILAVFRSFLSEATGFYHDLILKIRAKHGISQDDFSCEAVEGTGLEIDDKRTLELRRCQRSCHRCLIYLGDLARYKEFHGDGDAANHDWSIAAGFYVKAASLWPASGNPHNQLAVLATYVGDELLAVYHYFRSLAAETPFLTARDNLVLLFEKNRHSHVRLVTSSAEKASHVPGYVGQATAGAQKGKLKGEKTVGLGLDDAKSGRKLSDQQGSEEGEMAVNITETLKSFRVRFVRLNGILFTRTSVETFSDVHSCVLYELEQLLEFKDKGEAGLNSSLLSAGGIWGSGPSVVLQLVTILIFTVHNVNWGPDSHQPTYAEILQRSVILQHAFTATFECAACLMQQCVDADDSSMSPLLPAMLVIMEWLACRPEMAMGMEVGEKEANARVLFWRKCVNLLNKFLEEDDGDDGNESLSGMLESLSFKFSGEENDGRLVLWEDYELRGFTPLAPVQVVLDYSKKPTIGLGSTKERHARVRRLIRAGKAVSTALEGAEKGIYYDVETKKFYAAGDKNRKDKRRAVVGLSVTDLSTHETLDTKMGQKSYTDSNKKQPALKFSKEIKPPEEFPFTRIASGEEEDEVIVFKPSLMFERQGNGSSLESLQSQRNTLGISSSMPSSNPLTATWVGSKIIDSLGETSQKPLPAKAPLLTGIDRLLPVPVPNSISNTGNIPSTAPSDIGVEHSLSLGSVTVTSGLPMLAQDSSVSKALPSNITGGPTVNTTHFDSEDKLMSLGSTFMSSGPSATGFGGPSSGSMVGLVSGPFSSWGSGGGFDMFYNQSPWSPIPANSNWRPQDLAVGSSLWNNELQMLAAAKGIPGVRPGRGSGEVFSVNQVLPNLAQPSLSDNALQMTDIHSTPLRPVVSGVYVTSSSNDPRHKLLDGAMHVTQAERVLGKDDNFLHVKAAPAISSSTFSTVIKPALGSVNETEKAMSRVVGRSLPMRPPPGFGPVPGRSPLTTVQSTFEISQSMSDGYLASTPIQPKTASDNSQSLESRSMSEAEGQQQVDDYRWLDGYMPPRREISQIPNSNEVSSVGSSDYGVWTVANNAVAEVAASPFPGMKLSDRFSTPPTMPVPQKQQQNLIAQLQQEVLKHQLHFREQGHQQLIHEQHRQKVEQFQQLYGMQLIAQQEQQFQHQQNSGQQPHQNQQPQEMQPQLPQPPWHKQNYGRDPFVS